MEIAWNFGETGDLRSQLSDMPDAWERAEVTERSEIVGVVRRESDGALIGFTRGNLLRNGTHFHNTQVGDTVWITERGGISAHAPDPRSPRQQYDDMMTVQVKHMAEEIDRRFAADPTWQLE